MVMYHGLDAPSQAITPSHLFACWVKQFETMDETNTLSSLDRSSRIPVISAHAL
jgi:hypothetical protein